MTRLVLLGGLTLAGLLAVGPAQAQWMLPNSMIQSTRNNPNQDWNKNGIPDYLERQGNHDWNKNGIPDYLEMLPLASQRDWSMVPRGGYYLGGYYPPPYPGMPLTGGTPVSRPATAVRPHR
jgi:hypothetical protein